MIRVEQIILMKTNIKKSSATEKPVWFITGCSTGFGRDLAAHVLELGYRVVVTARQPEEIKDLAARETPCCLSWMSPTRVK